MTVREAVNSWFRRANRNGASELRVDHVVPTGDADAAPPGATGAAPDSVAAVAPPAIARREPDDSTRELGGNDCNPEPTISSREPDDSTRELGGGTQPLQPLQHGPSLWKGRHGGGATALSNIGRERDENQDRCFAQWIDFPVSGVPQPLGLFVVADGMGGHSGGAVASALAVETVVQQITNELLLPVLAGSQLDREAVVQRAIQAANAAIYQAAGAAGNDMGTTCTAAVLLGHELVIGHVGDSRALLIDADEFEMLTTDHSAIGRLLAIGALTPDEAHDHPLRNQLYRTVGQQPTIEVDTATYELEDATYLVLCSDGLWNLVPNAAIAQIVVDASVPGEAAKQLIDRANMLGGDDNISVVVVGLPAAAALL